MAVFVNSDGRGNVHYGDMGLRLNQLIQLEDGVQFGLVHATVPTLSFEGQMVVVVDDEGPRAGAFVERKGEYTIERDRVFPSRPVGAHSS